MSIRAGSGPMRARAGPWVFALAAACGSPAPSTPAPPATNPGHWRAGTPLPQPRFEGYAATLGGKIYYLGGITNQNGQATASSRVEVFDPIAASWSDAAPLPADGPRHHVAVAVVGDRIYVLGGFVGIIGGPPPGTFQPIAATHSFDGVTWRRVADQPLARGAATAQAIDGKIYVAGGGEDDIKTRSDLYVYDPSLNTWTKLASMPTSREHLASCAVGGRMVVGGGWSGADKATSTAVEVYDPATDAWSKLPGLPTSRGGLGGIEIGGVCHFIGGERWDISAPGTFSKNEGVDVATGTWRTFAPMQWSRHGIGVAALGNAIFVVGGGTAQGNSYTAAVEIFTP